MKKGREREQRERLSHMCWYAHARSTQKNIGNPTYTYTEFYTSTHTHTHVYTLLSLKIKFILKYVENSILEWALLHYVYSQCCCASIITVHQLALGTTSNREWKKTRPLLQIGRYFRIAYIHMYVVREACPACLPGQIGECVSWCVWSEDEQNIETFYRGQRTRKGARTVDDRGSGRGAGREGITLYTLAAVATVVVLSLNAKFPLHRPGAAGHTQNTRTNTQWRQTLTYTHCRMYRKSFKCLGVICNFKVPLIILLQYLSINFHTFFFFSSLRFILFRRAHTHTHTHSTAGRRCCFSRLVMASITSHRIDENDP